MVSLFMYKNLFMRLIGTGGLENEEKTLYSERSCKYEMADAI